MGRLPRPHVPGLVVHVVNRCHRQVHCFTSPTHFEKFLSLLDHYRRQYGAKVFNYVIMSNHVHLLCAAGTEAPLSAFLRSLFTEYARWYNREHGTSGHFWQGRYLASYIEDDTYGLACLRYQHLNPIRAGIVRQAGDYPWSGYAYYAGGKADRTLTPLPSYLGLAKVKTRRTHAYRRFVSEAPPPAEDRRRFRRRVVGSGPFRRRLGARRARPALPPLNAC